MNKTDYEAQVWEVATLIKLVASHNPSRICKIATRIKHIYDDDYDILDNNTIYNAYIEGGSI